MYIPQILPRTLIQRVLQNTKYSVKLDCCKYVLSILDMYKNVLATFIQITCLRIFLNCMNLLLIAAVAKLVNKILSFNVQNSTVLPYSFIMLFVRMGTDTFKLLLSW